MCSGYTAVHSKYYRRRQKSCWFVQQWSYSLEEPPHSIATAAVAAASSSTIYAYNSLQPIQFFNAFLCFSTADDRGFKKPLTAVSHSTIFLVSHLKIFSTCWSTSGLTSPFYGFYASLLCEEFDKSHEQYFEITGYEFTVYLPVTINNNVINILWFHSVCFSS